MAMSREVKDGLSIYTKSEIIKLDTLLDRAPLVLGRLEVAHAEGIKSRLFEMSDPMIKLGIFPYLKVLNNERDEIALVRIDSKDLVLSSGPTGVFVEPTGEFYEAPISSDNDGKIDWENRRRLESKEIINLGDQAISAFERIIREGLEDGFFTGT